MSPRETLFRCYGRVRALLLSVWLAGGIPNQNVLCGDLKFWYLGSRRIVGRRVLLYERGRSCCIGYSWAGLEFALFNHKQRFARKKGAEGPKIFARYQGILR